MSRSCFLSIFMVLGLMFNSLVHFELIFVRGIWQECNFIFMPIVITISAIKETIYPSPLNLLSFLVTCVDHIWDSLFLGSHLSSIGLPFDDYSFIVQSEMRKCDVSGFVLLSQDCFGYSGSYGVIQILDLFYLSEISH